MFLVAQQLYIPLRLYIYFFFFLSYFFSCPSMVRSMQACGSCGGQWGAEGSQEGRGAPKPNQNWKSIPNQTKPKLSPIICAWQNQINIEQLNQIKQEWPPKPNQNWQSLPNQTKPFSTKPNQKNFTKANLTNSNQNHTNKTKINQTKPDQNQPNQTGFNQVS